MTQIFVCWSFLFVVSSKNVSKNNCVLCRTRTISSYDKVCLTIVALDIVGFEFPFFFLVFYITFFF